MKRLLVSMAGICLLWNAVKASAQVPSFNSASLNGTYVFRLHANGVSTNTYSYSMVGVLTANGSGAITGGQFDLNNGAGASPQTPMTLTGTYTVNSDGRGTLTLNVAGANLPNHTNGNLVLSLALVSSSRAEMVEVTANETARGVMQQQVGTPSLATISGAYAVSGVAFQHNVPASALPPPSPADFAGQVTADGMGTISGTVDAGAVDAQQASMPVAGTFAFTSGRALGTNSGVSVVVYPVDNTTAYVMSLGPATTLTSGDAPEVLGTFELQH